MSKKKNDQKLGLYLAVGCALLFLGGCGTWETSSSVNVFGKIDHNTSNTEHQYQPYYERVDDSFTRNP